MTTWETRLFEYVMGSIRVCLLQRRSRHNKYVRKTVCYWISGLMIAATTAVAGDVTVEGGIIPIRSPYLVRKVSGQYRTEQPTHSSVNPWSLPQPLVRPPESQLSPEYFNPEAPGRSSGNEPQRRQGRSGSFVTPEILESLKQQQQHYQTMPGIQRFPRYAPRQNGSVPSLPGMLAPGMSEPGLLGPGMSMPGFPRAGIPGTGSYGYPSYGSGSIDPLYDVPTVSPWGDDADLLYRGESLPMMPNEAIGGFPPMPAFGMNNEDNSSAGEPVGGKKNNVFNPFTFLPNRSLREP